MTELEKAYLAGIVDGEGCITIAKNKTKYSHGYVYSPVFVITNTDLRLMSWLMEKLPQGAMCSRKWAKAEWKQGHSFRITGVKLGPILEEISPYLICKKDQARIVLGFISSMGGRGEPTNDSLYIVQEILYNKVKELNTRGPKHADRLSEEAPSEKKDDAIVGTVEKSNLQSRQEIDGRLQ